jgi:hypothetical protein
MTTETPTTNGTTPKLDIIAFTPKPPPRLAGPPPQPPPMRERPTLMLRTEETEWAEDAARVALECLQELRAPKGTDAMGLDAALRDAAYAFRRLANKIDRRCGEECERWLDQFA